MIHQGWAAPNLPYYNLKKALKGRNKKTIGQTRRCIIGHAAFIGLGFSRSGEFINPDDGPVWAWALDLEG